MKPILCLLLVSCAFAADRQLRVDHRVFTGLAEMDGNWAALLAASDGKVYAGLAYHGGDGHMVYYDSKTDTMHDVGNLTALTGESHLHRGPQSKIHAKFGEGKDGRIYFATHAGMWWNYARFGTKEGYPGAHWMAFEPKTGRVEDFGTGPVNEGINTGAYDPVFNRIYGLTHPRAHFVYYDVATHKSVDMGRLNNWESICRTLGIDDEGNVYGSFGLGRIFKYDPRKDAIEELAAQIPIRPKGISLGRDYNKSETAWRTVVWDRETRQFYGIEESATILFSFNPRSGEVHRLGQLCIPGFEDRRDIPFATLSLTLGHDRKLYYGASGREFDYGGSEGAATSHLITWDLKTGKKEDLGEMLLEDGRRVTGHQCRRYRSGRHDLSGRSNRSEARSGQAPGSGRPRRQCAVPSRADHLQASQMRIRLCCCLLAGAALATAQRTLEYDRSVVSQVRIDARELGYPPKDVIPSGESAIAALAVAPNGSLYGVTSGKRSHLFVLNPLHGYVQPLGFLNDAAVGLAVAKSGDVYIAGKHLLKYTPRRDEFRRIRVDAACETTDLGAPAEGQGIFAIAIWQNLETVYGLTEPDGQFFTYDSRTNKFTVHGKVAERRIPGEKFEKDKLIGRAVVVIKGGIAYTSGEGGALYRYHSEKLERLRVTLPTVPGREPYNRVDAWTQGPGGVLYGGTSDGYLFRFDPETERMENLGKPLNQYRIHGLVYARNGKLYGVGGDEDEMARLFSYDPARGVYELLGFIDVNRRPYYAWQAYQVGAMAIGLDGTVYIGQSERKSMLYLYYPE